MKIVLIFLLLVASPLLAAGFKISLVPEENPTECFLCKLVVGLLEGYVNESTTREELFSFLENDVCPLLVAYGFQETTCVDFVALYGPYVITAVLTEETPSLACDELKLCTNTTTVKRAGSIGTFWQVADMHIDVEYLPGSDPLSRCIKGTPPDGQAPAGPIGTYVCDTSKYLVEAALGAMAKINPSPDFIIWTGDAPPHYLDYSSVENYTKAMVLRDIQAMTSEISKFFPNSRVYPSLGNHDNYLADQLAPPPIGSEWLGELAAVWKDWLPADAVETFKYGGYYTSLIEPGLRIISLNTIYCDLLNTWAVIDPNKDIAGQFAWLNKTLNQARKNGESVYMIGHIPPGFTDDGGTPLMLPACNEQYITLFQAYSDVVIHNFFAHEHGDSFRVILDENTNKPIASAFVCPSMTPFMNHNPSIRMYSYDTTTKKLVNYHQYYSNLTADNEENQATFEFGYDWISLYGQDDMSPQSFYNVWNQMQTNQTAWELYQKWYNNNTPFPSNCDSNCKLQSVCAIGYFEYTKYGECFIQ